MNIYKDYCLEYLKAGYSVIPDGFKKKRPLIKGWTQYSDRQPSLEEVTNWCNQFNESNISVMLGEASGIIAIDVDTTDKDLLELINSLLPESPCDKIGSKGFTRFFKFHNELTSVLKDSGGNVILELLSTGKKTTIPPSIHTSGNPYSWVGKSLLEVDKSTLPYLPPQLLSTLELKIKESQLNTYLDTPKQKSGRHIALGALAATLISEHTEMSAAISKLIKYDKENHEKPLFSDPSENKVVSEYINALKFYSDYLVSINSKRQSKNEPLELPLTSSAIVKPFNSKSLEQEIIELPTPSGLLAEIQNHIISKSYVEQPVFALSAAISLIGTLGSRKFTFQGATPNTYILNIADSGSGKDSCQQAIKNILMDIGNSQLLGATSYPSEASIITKLSNTNPVRLDIIDEASSFLKAAANGEAYQAGIGDTLCEIFSCSNSRYLGKVLATQPNRIGECDRPHLNLLCSTTYKGISDGLSRSVLEKGLFARFLTFFGDNNKKGKRVLKDIPLKYRVLERLQRLASFTHPDFEGNLTHATPAYEVPVSDSANKLLDLYHTEFDTMRITEKSDSVIRPVVSRLYQQMMKIVLVSAISNTKVEHLPVVEDRDVKFAYQLIKFFYQSINGFINDNLYDSYRGRQVNEILKIVAAGGEEGVTTADLARIAKSMTSRDRQEILRDLVHSNQIEYIKTSDPSAPAFRRTS